MGKTTKDVSVRGVVYDIVRNYCREKGVAIGPEVSQWVDEYLDEHEGDVELEVELDAEIRRHFTF